MAKIIRNQRIGPDGKIVSEQVIELPDRIVSPEQAQQARAELRAARERFDSGGKEQREPTIAELRDWLMALTVALQDWTGELDDETVTA